MTTQTSITDLHAGRDLDRLIGERLFGYHVVHEPKGSPPWYALQDGAGRWVTINLAWREWERESEDHAWRDCPHFSTEIAAAWTVVEALRVRGWLVRVQEMPDGFPWRIGDLEENLRVFRKAVVGLYWMGLRGEGGQTPGDIRRYIRSHIWEYGDDAPLAICRAALLALAAEAEGDG